MLGLLCWLPALPALLCLLPHDPHTRSVPCQMPGAGSHLHVAARLSQSFEDMLIQCAMQMYTAGQSCKQQVIDLSSSPHGPGLQMHARCALERNAMS